MCHAVEGGCAMQTKGDVPCRGRGVGRGDVPRHSEEGTTGLRHVTGRERLLQMGPVVGCESPPSFLRHGAQETVGDVVARILRRIPRSAGGVPRPSRAA